MIRPRRPYTLPAFVCLLGLCATSCADAPPELQAPRKAVHAIWDPTTQTLPTPTNLVRDPTTGRLDLPIEENMPGAEREFREYLNTLDGYPITSTLSFPVSADLSNNGLSSSVFLAPEADGDRVLVDAQYDPNTKTIEATPMEALIPGTTYVYGLWGYDGGAQGARGEPVVADAPFYLVRASAPLTEHLSAIPGETREERLETANSLEEVRRNFTPVYKRLSAFGLPDERIAVAGSFSVTSAPSLWFDPETGKVPLPNNLLLDREKGLVQLPPRAEDDKERAHIKEALSRYDGFSTTAALVMEATEEIDPAEVGKPENIRVFHVAESGLVKEVQGLDRGVLEDGTSFWVRPKQALEDASNYVYVVRRTLRTKSGKELEPQPLAALLRGSEPLQVDGKSQVSSLDDDTAALIEPGRKETQGVLQYLSEKEGLTPKDFALVAPFRTLSATGYLMNWRAKLYEQNIRTDLVNVLAKTPRERGLLLAMPSVRTIVSGHITTLDHLDPKTKAMYKDGRADERQIPFVLTIPRNADKGKPIPTVLFGHGLATSRELLYMIANKLASNGFAAITVDLPYHGERSVCLKDGDCKDGATCNELHQCVKSSGEPGDLNRFNSPWPDGPSYPVTSGDPFIDMHDIEGSRDHFVQAVIDLCQLRRVISNASWEKATGGYLLDGDDVVYLGMSLGGILGAVLTGVEPSIGTYVLNVPGGSLIHMVEHSAAFSTMFERALLERDIKSRDSDAYFTFANGIRWMTDPVDPINITWRAVQKPWTYTDPVDGQQKTAPIKRVMIQMAEKDSVVPNITTKLLSERSGIPYRKYTPTISNHAFLFDPTSLEGARARNDMIDFFKQR